MLVFKKKVNSSNKALQITFKSDMVQCKTIDYILYNTIYLTFIAKYFCIFSHILFFSDSGHYCIYSFSTGIWLLNKFV